MNLDELMAGITQLEEALWARQLQVYPDSRRMFLHDIVQTWLVEVDPNLEDRARRFAAASFNWPPPIELWNAEHRLSVARHVVMCMQNPAGVFYECGKRPDGTYAYRGFRYGFDASEYLSGFGRF